jgi:toxin ParE1/3/4
VNHVRIRPQARNDLRNILNYLIQEDGPDLGHRFRAAALASFRDLIRFPDLGVRRRVRKREFTSVRMWRIPGFEKYLVFYFPRANGIEIERVIHASQDYRRMLW